jgi:Methyltransferase domain
MESRGKVADLGADWRGWQGWMSEQGDDKFYQVIRRNGIAERLLISARERMYAEFIRACAPSPSSTIVDVGVSDILNDGANFLERLYPYRDRVTACGLNEAADFCRTFREVKYLRIQPNSPLPFRDREFDIATSNAVLEHVGSEGNQVRFLSELCRVGKTVFVSVPNRYFPVEHHTAIPFLHWTDTLFHAACGVLGKNEWREEENLILMTKQRLEGLLPKSRQWTIGYTGLPLGPLSSNLYAVSPG